MVKLFRTIKLYYMIGYVILNSVRYSWYVTITTRSHKFANKVIIRVDDTDFEYLCMLHGLDYEPLSLEDGLSFKPVMTRTYNNVKKYIKGRK